MSANFGSYKVIRSHLLLVPRLPRSQADGGVSSDYKLRIIRGVLITARNLPQPQLFLFLRLKMLQSSVPPSFLLSPESRQWLKSDCVFKQLPTPDPSPVSVWLEHWMREGQ